PFVDGWFPTGDLGRIDPELGLTVAGRRGDVIVTGGEKVWPEPVERVIAARADVAEVALVGRPDPEWGHRVTAVVVTAAGHPDPTLESLRDTVKAELPAWAAPKELEIRTALPRTSLGKVRRNRL
ncbi:MAG: AMP-dependent synthetase, partial [Actinomycetota bacterium]